MEASILFVMSCLAAGVGPQWLEQHDPVWETPPVKWNTGIPLGNGHIGALIWGDGQPLKITLDKYDAWETREKPLEGLTYAKLREMVRDGRQEEAEQCMRTEHIYGDDPYPTRLPMPRVELDFGGPVAGYEARLSLAEARADIRGENVHVAAQVLADRNVLLLRVSGPAAGSTGLRIGYDHLSPSARETLKRWGYQGPVFVTDVAPSYLFERTPSGYEYAVAWARHTLSDTEETIAIALASNTESSDPVEAARALAEQCAVAEPGLAPHRQWWNEFWQRSFLTIPDARLESLYYIEMYKLGCSSRPGGLPITLQGVWTLDGGLPPWSGDYHLDMNVQQSYWPIYAANRLELGEPLYRTFSACIPRWREQCREFFGFDGVWSGCAIGPRGERIYGYSGVELWPGNAAWLAHHYWLHWLYSQDKEFLREQALPMMRLCFLTYANMLEKGADGKLHVPLSYSPEYHEGSVKAYAPDPTCDLALIRFLGRALLEANGILGAEDELTPRVREVLAELVDYPQSDGQVWISADQPMERSHRHHSHLMMLHPLAVVSPEGPEAERRLIERSLHQIRVLGPGQWTGWAYPWMSLIASRAGYGNWAWQMLDVYANSFITPNTFHINGDPRIFGLSLFDYEPMTLEAGFGAAAAIQEMLLQSQGGIIRLFPSMPDRWHDASFEGLRAEGAFIVTAKRAGGETAFVRIASEAGGLCRVRDPFSGTAFLQAGEGRATPIEAKDGVLEFATEPGMDYLLWAPEVVEGGVPELPNREQTVFERSAADGHFYGLKRLPRF